MIDPKQLLDDLQSLLTKTIEPDLRERSELPEIAAALAEEFEVAKKAERTALNYTDWRSDYITQIGVGWVLSCVFIRFLEDNDLIDPPKLSGPAQTDDNSQASLQRARDEYDLYIKANPTHSFREYILSSVDQLAKLPGVSDIFGDKNVIHQQRDWLSNDAAKALYNFWQTIEPETGRLVHSFVDDSGSETFDTRFLGDLYQDLSERARKKYALLQTPDFVEEFILDRTLEPALDEFGLTPGKLTAESDSELTADSFLKMIDPACGSGHFLLGAFPRILRRWQQKEPGTKVDVLVQRTLYSIHGVDINPFAIAIARFRLLLASLKACGIARLKNSIDFDLSNLACGDSLYHGRQKQQALGDWTDESHYFQTEDADNLKRILQEGTFHAVVANPPYITPKDKAANKAYRQLYPESCHRQYSLSVPFMERIFRLATTGISSKDGVENLKLESNDNRRAGFTGQITGNSFMKREFGKKLIETFFPKTDLTHVIDTSGAYIPGHGTPTVILLGRNRKSVATTIRTVMGIRGEPTAPADASKGKVWTAIINQVDEADSLSEFVSTSDSQRELFGKHPWSISGGGAAELKLELESSCKSKLMNKIDQPIGRSVRIGEEDVFIFNPTRMRNSSAADSCFRVYLIGENIRDWGAEITEWVWYPYRKPNSGDIIRQEFWSWRTLLANRKTFQGKMADADLTWADYQQHTPSAYETTLSIAYGFVSTHNHFVLDRGGKVFKQSAPVVKLPADSTENDHFALLGLLNSSVACFWIRNGASDKGMSGGVVEEQFERFFMLNGTYLAKFPIPGSRPHERAKRIDQLANELQLLSPESALAQTDKYPNEPANSENSLAMLSDLFSTARDSYNCKLAVMINCQEDLDWECYRLYSLVDEDLSNGTLNSESDFGIQLGERAFEIVMARKMAAGELQTTWFERHDSTPIIAIPDHWPDDYKQLVQRRIEVIESNPKIALIEQPECKRRWNTEPWDSQVDRALKSWLLGRLESYFDFDGRMSEPQDDNTGSRETPPLADIHLVSVAQLADVAAKDSQFIEVANVYRDREDFDIVKLVDELVSEEHVPALPILRYKPSGLDKRAAWEETWELQRSEDTIEARVRDQLEGLLKLGGKKKDKEGAFRKDLPADSPLLEFFSHVQVETKDGGVASDTGKEEKTSSQDGFMTVDEIVRRAVKQEMGEIPVPPKYASKDMISTSGAKYWKLRGKLDVPKERWVSFPNTEGEDQTRVIAWAGYDHLQLLRAIAAYFADVQQRGGSDDPRLVPLLAAMDQQIPWVKQWHNEIDDEFGYALGDYFENFIEDEARNLDMTLDDVRNWEPPKKVKKKRAKKATKKKATKKKEEV